MESQNLSAVSIRKKTVHQYIIFFCQNSNYNKYDTDKMRIIEFINFILTVLVNYILITNFCALIIIYS